jgi:hypothetical protein
LIDGAKINEASDLRTKRCLFTHLKANLELWINSQGNLEVDESEGYVADTDAADGDYDGPHKKDGAHYSGLGCDINLFRNGVLISSGSDEVWQFVGTKWESMHPLCRWGGRFGDANHISLINHGVK